MHHRIHHFIGRHRGRHGFGHFGRGFMEGGGMGGRGFGMGRKLGLRRLAAPHTEAAGRKIALRLRNHQGAGRALQRLLRPEPRHGVSRAHLPRRDRPRDRRAPMGARKLYTSPRRARSTWRRTRAAADALFAQFGRVGERMDRVRRALDAEEAGEESGADHERRGSQELHRARRDLKLALADKWHSSREEQQRIAEILAARRRGNRWSQVNL